MPERPTIIDWTLNNGGGSWHAITGGGAGHDMTSGHRIEIGIRRGSWSFTFGLWGRVQAKPSVSILRFHDITVV
jgi:hypothetical protein